MLLHGRRKWLILKSFFFKLFILFIFSEYFPIFLSLNFKPLFFRRFFTNQIGWPFRLLLKIFFVDNRTDMGLFLRRIFLCYLLLSFWFLLPFFYAITSCIVKSWQLLSGFLNAIHRLFLWFLVLLPRRAIWRSHFSILIEEIFRFLGLWRTKIIFFRLF